MAYIVKSSLEIKPTVLSTRDIEKLIKDKEEYLNAKKVIIPEETIIPEEEAKELKEEEVLEVSAEEVVVEEKNTKRGKGGTK